MKVYRFDRLEGRDENAQNVYSRGVIFSGRRFAFGAFLRMFYWQFPSFKLYLPVPQFQGGYARRQTMQRTLKDRMVMVTAEPLE